MKLLIFSICCISGVLGGEKGYMFVNDIYVKDIVEMDVITESYQGIYSYMSNFSGRMETEFVERENGDYIFTQTWRNIISTYRKNDEMRIDHASQKLNGAQFQMTADSTGAAIRTGLNDTGKEMEERNTALIFFSAQDNILYPFGSDSLRQVGDTWTIHNERHFEEFPGFDNCVADYVGDNVYTFDKIKTKKGKEIAYISMKQKFSMNMITQTWDESWELDIVGIFNAKIQYNVTDNKDVKYKLRGTFSGDGVDLENDELIYFTENMDIQCKRKSK